MLDLSQAKHSSAALHQLMRSWTWVRPCGGGGGFAGTARGAPRPRFQNWRDQAATQRSMLPSPHNGTTHVLKFFLFLCERSLEAVAFCGQPVRTAVCARVHHGPTILPHCTALDFDLVVKPWRFVGIWSVLLCVQACSHAATCMFLTHHESRAAQLGSLDPSCRFPHDGSVFSPYSLSLTVASVV